MKKKKIFGFLGLGLLSLVSCDKDFNTVGADLIGDGNYQFDKYTVENLKAFTRATGAVQTNNMPINALGVFEDPVFGTTKAHFFTQLELDETDPDFGIDAQIQTNDSIYLYIPYFNTLEDTDSNGNNTYSLDSIHGDLSESFELKIFESNYLLNTYDPANPTELQKYYSDQKHLIENNLVGTQLNNSSNAFENSNFKFRANEIIIYETDGNGNYVDSDGNIVSDPSEWVVKERLEPGMWINLDKTFFNNKILQANSTNLFNNNNFKEYFRGLYFQTTQNTGGALAKLDFSSGYIIMQYHSKVSSTSDYTKDEIQINLSGNTVNFLENDLSTATSGDYQSALGASSDEDEILYLKGGNGSVAFIDLFGTQDTDNNGVSDELDNLRDQGWLINDAILTININNEVSLGEEPKRIYLYDVTNSTVLLDYTYDSSTATDEKNNKYYFGGILELDDNDKGDKYRFSLLHYINNLIQTTDEDDLKNIRLGLVVTETINNVTNYGLESVINSGLPTTLPLASSATSIDVVPLSNVMNPLGTVLYGSHTNVDEDKRMKLEIYYTKPN